jgi:hypothetical protein
LTYKIKKRCATDDYHKALLALHGERYKVNRMRDESSILNSISSIGLRTRGQLPSVVTIPVVVHVVYRGKQDNITDEQIQSQINILNKDYRKMNSDITKVPGPFKSRVGDARIEFQLACRDPSGNSTNGITRTHTTEKIFYVPNNPPSPREEKIKFKSKGGKDAWDTQRYLNLWLCNDLRDRNDQGILGYAQFPRGPPETDGVVIAQSAFGNIGTASVRGNPYNKGRTATHEIGHYLGVYHIWGDESTLQDPCRGTDNVGDTPNQRSYNTGNPNFPSMDEACPSTGRNGTMFMNYMDYSYDESLYMFTKGQIARMRAVLVNSRSSLLQSDALLCSQADSSDLMKLPTNVYNAVDSLVPVENIL